MSVNTFSSLASTIGTIDQSSSVVEILQSYKSVKALIGCEKIGDVVGKVNALINEKGIENLSIEQCEKLSNGLAAMEKNINSIEKNEHSWWNNLMDRFFPNSKGAKKRDTERQQLRAKLHSLSLGFKGKKEKLILERARLYIQLSANPSKEKDKFYVDNKFIAAVISDATFQNNAAKLIKDFNSIKDSHSAEDTIKMFTDRLDDLLNQQIKKLESSDPSFKLPEANDLIIDMTLALMIGSQDYVSSAQYGQLVDWFAQEPAWKDSTGAAASHFTNFKVAILGLEEMSSDLDKV